MIVSSTLTALKGSSSSLLLAASAAPPASAGNKAALMGDCSFLVALSGSSATDDGLGGDRTGDPNAKGDLPVRAES